MSGGVVLRTVHLIPWGDSEHEQRTGEYLQAEAELAQVEAELKAARRLLKAFIVEHDRMVKPLYAELNRLEAEIADLHAARASGGDDVGDAGDAGDAGRARERARTSDSYSYSAGQYRAAAQPSADTKKLYRKLARHSHPDLATGEADRAVREVFMARVNNAYARGDTAALSALSAEWDGARPSSAQGTPSARVPRPRSVSVEDILSRLTAARAELQALKTTGLGGILFDSADGDMAEALTRLEAVADDVRERVADRRAMLIALLEDAGVRADQTS